MPADATAGGDPAASDPANADPPASDPAASDPADATAGGDPAASDPANADPPASDPAASDPPASDPAPVAMGLFRFTVAGRAAPGLFVGGWIAALIGVGAGFVGLLAGRTLAGVVLFGLGMSVVLVALILLGGAQTIERRHARLAYAGPAPILTFLAVVVGWYLGAVVVLTPLQLMKVDVAGPALVLLGIGLQAIVVILILRVMVVGSGALTWADMGVRRPDRQAVRDFVAGALIAGPVVLVTAIAVAVLIAIVNQQPASPLPPTGTSTGLAMNLLAGALIAPAYEELFFRGFTQTAWRRMTGPRTAIVRVALLFAFIHVVDQSGATFGAALGVAVVAAGARIPVALALGYVFERRGSLWASIGLHATFNAILLIVAERALTA